MAWCSCAIALGSASALALSAAPPADASRIWYRCGDAICVTRADGRGEPREWATFRDVGQFDVTRDGRRIAFIARGSLAISDARRATVRSIIIRFAASQGSYSPQFRADDRRIVWHQALDGYEPLTCDATTRGRLVRCFHASRSGLMAWGPQGSIIFSHLSSPSRRHAAVCVLRIEPDGDTRCRRTILRGDESRPLTDQPELSRDGRRLLVSQGGRAPRVAIYDVRRRRLLRVVATVRGDIRNPSWSPDERHVVFDLTEPGTGTRSVWVARVKRGKPRRLVGDGAWDPHWSR